MNDCGFRPRIPGATGRCIAGFLFGLGMIAAMYALLWVEHNCSLATGAISPDRGLSIAVTFVTCFLVGVFEEGLFRGYAQFKLAHAIGFWPAAFTLSVAFGIVHLVHPTYTMLGVGGAAFFGVLFAYCLWRTGDLWLAVGIHAAVDFAELFVFAPASSSARLFTVRVHGPAWLTGGTGGPEGSVNGYVVIALAFLIVWAATSTFCKQHARRLQLAAHAGR